jgi:hypothetical protein
MMSSATASRSNVTTNTGNNLTSFPRRSTNRSCENFISSFFHLYPGGSCPAARFQSPPKREWLPRETDAILSLNAERFDRDDLPKKWRNEDFWLQTWPGLIGAASQTPRLRIPADTSRVTRALTTAENSPPREFLLVEARDNISSVVRTIAEDKQFEKRTISGLPVWQRSDFSIARVGPKTLAVGLPDGVDELVRVRLGLDADLDITGEFFDRFQALDP